MIKYLVNLRNFSYYWSVKQYDQETAFSEYKHKVRGFISGYILLLLLSIFQLILYVFDLGIQHLPVGRNDPWWMKMLAGGILFGLPWFLVSHYLVKKVEHIPIPVEYSSRQYRKYSWIFWIGFLLGWLLAIGVGMFLLSYLRGKPLRFVSLL